MSATKKTKEAKEKRSGRRRGRSGIGSGIMSQSSTDLSTGERGRLRSSSLVKQMATTMKSEACFWGDSLSIGLGTRLFRKINIKQVASGARHAVCLSNDGRVYSWGDNTSGQLGLGDMSIRKASKHVEVPLPSKCTPEYVVCGQQQTAVVTGSGRVFFCGFSYSTFVPVASLERMTMPEGLLLELSLGPSAVIALVQPSKRDTTEVYTWGSCDHGQLGHGQAQQRLPQPTFVESFFDESIQHVVCGETHMAAVSLSGEVWCWGDNLEGYLGVSDAGLGSGDMDASSAIVSKPARVRGALTGKTVTQVVCGVHFTVAVTENGRVYSWGRGAYGQLGHGDSENVLFPKKIGSIARKFHIEALATGGKHTIALSDTGQLLSWGTGRALRLGTETSNDVMVPTPIEHLTNKIAFDVACGASFTLTTITTMKVTVCYQGNKQSVTSEVCPQIFDVLKMVCTYWKLQRPGDFELVTPEGVPLTGFEETRKVLAQGTTFLWLVQQHQLIDDEDENLIFDRDSQGNILFEATENTIPVSAQKAFQQMDKRGRMSGGSNSSSRLSLLVQGPPAAAGRSRSPSPAPASGTMSPSSSRSRSPSPARSVKKGLMRRSILTKSKSSENRMTVAKKGSMSELTLLVPDSSAVQSDPTSNTSSSALATSTCSPVDLLPRLPLVKVATLDRLIEWLTLNRFTGFSFLDTFLLTYKSLGLTPLSLLTRLIDTYSSPASLTVEDLPEELQHLVLSKSQNVLKMRVLTVILRWLQSNPYDFLNQDMHSRDVVEQLLEFIEGEPMLDFRKEAEKIRRVLVFNLDPTRDEKAIQRRQKMQPKHAAPPDPPLHSNPVDLFKYTPREFARQLTLVDFFDFFQKINRNELLNQAWTKAATRDRTAANVVRMIRRYNLGAEWVSAMILRAPDHALRVRTVQRFIDICEELMELGNLNSILMILSAFSSVPIFRLKSIWEGRPGFKAISPMHQDKLQKLREATSGDRNRAAYRETFAQLPYPKLPFLGVYLTDLTFVDEGNTPFLPSTSTTHLNFKMRRQIAELIFEIEKVQSIPYQIQPVEELMTYLYGVRGFDDHENTAYNLSKAIESRDGVNEEAEVDRPTLLSCTFEDYALTQTPLRFGDTEVNLLNSRARMAMENTKHTRARRQLWRSWVRQLASKDCLFVDEEGRPQTFLDVFLYSEALEISVQSIISSWPQQETELQLFQHILQQCTSPELDRELLLNVLHGFSRSRLDGEQIKHVRELITAYKRTLPFYETTKMELLSDADRATLLSVDEIVQALESSSSAPSSSEPSTASTAAAAATVSVGKESPAPSSLSRASDQLRGIIATCDTQSRFIVQRVTLAQERSALLANASTDVLLDHMRNLREVSEKRIATLSQEKNRVVDESTQTLEKYGKVLDTSKSEVATLTAEREELERQLRAVKKKLSSAKAHCERIEKRIRREARDTRSTLHKLESKIEEETAFIDDCASSSVDNTFEDFTTGTHAKLAAAAKEHAVSLLPHCNSAVTEYANALQLFLKLHLADAKRVEKELEVITEQVKIAQDFGIPVDTSKHSVVLEKVPRFVEHSCAQTTFAQETIARLRDQPLHLSEESLAQLDHSCSQLLELQARLREMCTTSQA